MIINRVGKRFVASFDAAELLRRVINNTENTELVFESMEENSTNSAMLVDGDVDKVEKSIISMGIPCLKGV
jgi:hypothetical protein